MNKKLKKRIFWSIFTLILIFLLLLLVNKAIKDSNQKATGYSQDYFNRPKPDYTMNLNEVNDSVEIYSLNYKSKEFLNSPALIYGLLFLPKNKKNIPGIVLLPGGGVSKEGFKTRSIALANSGYAVLVIDQRGIGETGGMYPSYEEDYQIFNSGKEPIQHLSVYDALVASDILREIENINEKNIGIVGESMGGRYAIIATALDKKLKGVIVISSAGFHFKENSDSSQPYTPYLLSIDPDTYITMISPRPMLMLHGDNDSMVKLEDAQYTFNLAKQPKRFFIAKNCGHGYCTNMSNELEEDLKILFGK
jgi:uncharacterized protein